MLRTSPDFSFVFNCWPGRSSVAARSIWPVAAFFVVKQPKAKTSFGLNNQALARSNHQCEARRVRAYEELVEFIASLNPRDVLDFKPSEPARQRVWELIERQKEAPLPDDEKAELEHYVEIEHLMRLAKARARQLLAHGQ